MTQPDRETVLAAIRECVTVVQPGEVLAVRLRAENIDDIGHLAGQLREIHDKLGITVLFVEGEEFARIIPGPSQAPN